MNWLKYIKVLLDILSQLVAQADSPPSTHVPVNKVAAQSIATRLVSLAHQIENDHQ